MFNHSFINAYFQFFHRFFHRIIIGQWQTFCQNFVVELSFVAIEVIGLRRLQFCRLFCEFFQCCVCYFWESLDGIIFTVLTLDIHDNNFSTQLPWFGLVSHDKELCLPKFSKVLILFLFNEIFITLTLTCLLWIFGMKLVSRNLWLKLKKLVNFQLFSDEDYFQFSTFSIVCVFIR